MFTLADKWSIEKIYVVDRLFHLPIQGGLVAYSVSM